MNGIIIIGSSRSDGNTRKIVDQMAHFNNSLDIVDLNDKNIGYYDYSHANEEDDYIPLVERVLNYDLIFFVTPVYWYSMSAIMKTFFDRITDLLTIRKDLGRKLRGKMMGSISCGSDNGGLVESVSHRCEVVPDGQAKAQGFERRVENLNAGIDVVGDLVDQQPEPGAQADPVIHRRAGRERRCRNFRHAAADDE